MRKITLEMVKYWVGWTEDESIKVIKEIANSAYEDFIWTPKILRSNILETWDINKEDRKSQAMENDEFRKNNKTVSIKKINQQIAKEINEQHNTSN